MPAKIQRYGWVRNLPDQRDHLYSAPLLTLPVLPDKVDLRSQCPPVYNQGELGSCTANALAAAFQFGELKEKEKDPFIPSRLFIYYNERVLEHTVSSDSGAQLRDGMKTLAKQGVCPETDWPYDPAKFAAKPPQKCFIEAVDHRATQYQRLVQNLTQMKGCLATGFPFVLGFTVYESFESPEVARTGIVPMPGTGEAVVGGHAVMAVGYDEPNRVFIVRNSWGDGWGMKGYFTMPYAYLTQSDLSSDFWTVRFVK
jgi:C1A family cysteine protease